ncbi:hypothetical protein FPQ18DRAFT_304869 [Pyronema domesticum]|nr:hypothetical protein FPQ18DRAFT_304869 [Pyronema domesticum]
MKFLLLVLPLFSFLAAGAAIDQTESLDQVTDVSPLEGREEQCMQPPRRNVPGLRPPSTFLWQYISQSALERKAGGGGWWGFRSYGRRIGIEEDCKLGSSDVCFVIQKCLSYYQPSKQCTNNTLHTGEALIP